MALLCLVLRARQFPDEPTSSDKKAPSAQMWQGILSYKIHMLCHHPRTIGVELFQISPVVFGNKTFVCFPYIYIGKADFAPWQPCFSTGQIFFSRGSPNIFLSFSFWLPYQPDFCMEWKYFSNFERGPPKYNSCEVW